MIYFLLVLLFEVVIIYYMFHIEVVVPVYNWWVGEQWGVFGRGDPYCCWVGNMY